MKVNAAPLLVVCALLAASCGDKDDGPSESSIDTTGADTFPEVVDNDGDGVTANDGDCDDNNAQIFPGRSEDCNAIDDNCNGLVDEGFGDGDGDGTADCLDSEECDGLDNDGDAVVDEGFPDVDGDGVADCELDEQCDGLDNDNDGLVDEGYDQDGDGVTTCDGDCDDDDADAYPGNTEVPEDGVDNDCDGLYDEGSFAEGALIIVEIMANPGAVSDPRGEWFEVYNNSEADFTLNGLVISGSDGDYHQITSRDTLVLGAGEVAVLGINGDRATNGGVDVDYVYSNVSLSNESDDLILSADGVVLHQVSWDDGATMPDPDGASIGLDPGFYGPEFTGDAAYWCAATESWGERRDQGSPGEPNELCSTFDHDGDGYSGDDGDCDDDNNEVYPGAPEITPNVDNDCDGDAEQMPTAVASVDAVSSLLHCDILYLNGAASSDPDGSALTYRWELTSAPGASALTSADINTSSSMNPTFTPDVAGNYTFTLTVNDGGTDSFPVTVSATIGTQSNNTAPVADAGADQSYSESQTCQAWSYGAYYTCSDCSDRDFTLDASDSSDVNSSDHMTYSWSIISNSSYASINSTTSPTPTVTVGGLSATYGSTNSVPVVVQLQVTDCYGVTSATDSVTLTYNCTGI
ncbi:MAG: lamin tail domain-containing protein [Alphaproteobacteria bacterium]|nr:lamin tail domain-containing protein [Alphaproteobacteria bacterium]